MRDLAVSDSTKFIRHIGLGNPCDLGTVQVARVQCDDSQLDPTLRISNQGFGAISSSLKISENWRKLSPDRGHAGMSTPVPYVRCKCGGPVHEERILAAKPTCRCRSRCPLLRKSGGGQGAIRPPLMPMADQRRLVVNIALASPSDDWPRQRRSPVAPLTQSGWARVCHICRTADLFLERVLSAAL